MSELLVVKSRPVGPVLPGHVAEARRRMRPAREHLAAAGRARTGSTLTARATTARSNQVSDAELLRALWIARALPVALDVAADARVAKRLDQLQLSSAEVCIAPSPYPNHLLAVGFLTHDGAALEVRFLPVGALASDVRALALVRWPLVERGAVDEKIPVIHRFVHGPRRGG